MTDATLPALPSRLVVVVGPTAVGKSELAAGLARRLGGEVIGADSRQVYRYMDVATAKPSAALRAEIPHHLIDVVDPDQPYDVARWREDALRAIADVHARGRVAIVCGGTGLYVRSLTKGLFEGPAADEALRAQLLEAEHKQPGRSHQRLREVDPTTAERLHANDLVRIVRALEVFELTGRPLSSWHGEHALGEEPFESLLVELRMERADLDRRIDERSRAMVQAGLLEELRDLRARGYGAELTSMKAIGYREAGDCLDGALERDELAPSIARATRQYAKRQRVWLRGQAATTAVAHDDVEAALRAASTFLSVIATRSAKR